MEDTAPKLCTKCKERPRRPSCFRCAECINAAYRAWASNNRDKIKASRERSKKLSPDYYRDYYHAHRESLLQYQREYLVDKPHAKACYALNRKAKKHGKPDSLKPQDILDLFERQAWCQDCGDRDPSNLTVTHAFPLIFAPARNTPENLVRLCKTHAKAQGVKLHRSIKTDELAQHYQFTDE